MVQSFVQSFVGRIQPSLLGSILLASTLAPNFLVNTYHLIQTKPSRQIILSLSREIRRDLSLLVSGQSFRRASGRSGYLLLFRTFVSVSSPRGPTLFPNFVAAVVELGFGRVHRGILFHWRICCGTTFVYTDTGVGPPIFFFNGRARKYRN